MNRKLPLLLAALMTLAFGSLTARAADKPAEAPKAEAAKPAATADKPADASKAADDKEAKKKARQKRHVHTRDHKHQ